MLESAGRQSTINCKAEDEECCAMFQMKYKLRCKTGMDFWLLSVGDQTADSLRADSSLKV